MSYRKRWRPKDKIIVIQSDNSIYQISIDPFSSDSTTLQHSIDLLIVSPNKSDTISPMSPPKF